VTAEQSAALEALIGELQDAYRGLAPLRPTAVQRGRAAVRYGDSGRLPLTEEDQQRFDTLHGLVRWGQMAAPILRVDPAIFAEERRRARPEGAPSLPPRPTAVPDWAE